ncbi:MAG TPA: glycerophosphoryl diester phosphodiesterase membrane domain-containing protein [Solirubrobacteraceae bacterium]|nr:glycerophosphoryl diester phosphodiesterase membrane domain-containing protein [Solirubrobacteraceae bacterium]
MSAPSYTPQLRPLSVGEMLDAGFRLFRARFGTLMVCVLVPILPFTILGTVLQASIDDTAFDVNATTSDADGGTVFAGLVVATLVQSAAIALAIAACFRAISAAYLGERAGAGDSLRYAIGRAIPLLVSYIVFVIIVSIGTILLIIPGIFLATKLSMTFAALVFERKGPFGALGRSWTLTRNNFWRVFGTLLIVAIITFVFQLVVGGIIGAILGGADASELAAAVVTTLLNVIMLAVTYPLWAAVVSVVYYDLRVRNEGFDLQLLAQGVGADTSRFQAAPERPDTPPPPPAPPGSGGGFAPPEGSTTSS